MNKICLVVIALFFASLISSCDSVETSSPTTNTTLAGQDSMFFTVDGVAYKFKLSNTFNVNDSIYMFEPSDAILDRHLRLIFSNPTLGTFSTKGSTPTIFIYYYHTQSTPYSANPATQDSVTVVITELSPNFKATFHGTFNRSPLIQTGPPTITMTGGSINAKVN